MVYNDFYAMPLVRDGPYASYLAPGLTVKQLILTLTRDHSFFFTIPMGDIQHFLGILRNDEISCYLRDEAGSATKSHWSFLTPQDRIELLEAYHREWKAPNIPTHLVSSNKQGIDAIFFSTIMGSPTSPVLEMYDIAKTMETQLHERTLFWIKNMRYDTLLTSMPSTVTFMELAKRNSFPQMNQQSNELPLPDELVIHIAKFAALRGLPEVYENQEATNRYHDNPFVSARSVYRLLDK
jgi:hypothetical protein